ncbi:LysE family translocator [Rhizobium sp. P32RR-XVIII]|uniref:LysE family translocator n=1 Tax=Rhizobium sp. P32RR-XVIII TaxID=2726738 RepID=UPI001FEF8609|nr:LysE family transporter [Rhizobium sp. P32RR-XVIII]
MIIETLLVLFVKGALLGLVVTAPPGPIATLCINRSLHRGFGSGVAIGIGAALGDSCYALVAAAGLAMVSDALDSYSLPIAAAGGIVLIVLGIRDLMTPPAEAVEVGARNFFRTVVSTFLLAISNPGAFLSFGGLFAGLGLVNGNTVTETAAIVTGVFFGAMVWWTALSAAVNLARDRISSDLTLLIRRISGGLIIAFGVVVLGYAGTLL